MDLNDAYIASASYDGQARVWDPQSGACLHTLTGHANRLYSVKLHGPLVLTSSLDTNIGVWNAENGQCVHTLRGRWEELGIETCP